MAKKLVVSSSPHIKSPENIQSIMVDVLIALFPVALMAVFLFGYRALVTMIIAMVAAMVTEAIILRKGDFFGDGSAAVTGLLLAMTLPPAPPWWLVVIGSVVAIAIGKQIYGGIGSNIFNPALVGRAILLVSWGGHIAGNVWLKPVPFGFAADAVTEASPLATYDASLLDLFIGTVSGSLGETSALALIIGAIWLFYRGHIDWRIPGGFIGIVFIMGLASGGFSMGLYHVLAGGVLLGALFMATDMVTSPVTKTGKIIFGVGCGLITMLIRLYGSLPEGVTFGILLMNGLTPLIDNLTLPKKFGEVKKSA
ncbi:MAG TPA: RnfABCDGE type electron transport complex subunit D [Firmicutes bacterium]|jgi:electron transport complex protein RnfD|nr:RnfABCDGE type electron transport complex subunit D [Bacillota bacterium]